MAEIASLYRPRRQFLRFHRRKERWGVLVCHRRAGKTVAIVNELIERGLYTKKPNARYSYVAPFYAQAKNVAWDYLLRYSEPFRKSMNISELRVDLINGSVVRLFGGDNPDALRGLYNDGVGLDEPAQFKDRLWPEVIRPSLADRKGWAVFTGTPAGKNSFWKIWDDAQKDSAWFHMMLKASESGILDEEELEAARASMDEDTYAQEFECSFDAAIRGSYYGKDMFRCMHDGRIGSFPHNEEFKVHTCWDLGFTDDTVIWFFQVIAQRPVFINCYAASGLAMADYINTLNDYKRDLGYNYGVHYFPHDIRARSLQTGRSIQDQLLTHDIRGKIAPEMSVQDGIQATRLMLAHACFDEANCSTGIEALRQYQREWDEDKKTFRQRPRHDWTSHYADGIRIGALGYQEDYSAPQVYIPVKYRDKPPITGGVQLEKLWPSAKRSSQVRI